jgi:hypothetical protein
VTFDRLRAADWVAMVAAVALLFVMAADWYSNAQGVEARRIEHLSQGARGGEAGQVEREVNKLASEVAEENERNAWQLHGAIDRVILVVLLAAVVLAIAAGFLRAAHWRFEPPATPSGAAAVAAALGGLLVLYRLIQQPGFDAGTRVKAGVPLALVALGALALASAASLRNEQLGRPERELPQPERAPVPQ